MLDSITSSGHIRHGQLLLWPYIMLARIFFTGPIEPKMVIVELFGNINDGLCNLRIRGKNKAAKTSRERSWNFDF